MSTEKPEPEVIEAAAAAGGEPVNPAVPTLPFASQVDVFRNKAGKNVSRWNGYPLGNGEEGKPE